MISLPAYLAARFVYRFIEFLRRWYIESFWFAGGIVRGVLARFDSAFSISATFRSFFYPPSRGKTAAGYVLLHALQTLRATIGAVVYALVTSLIAALYLGWLSLPIFVLFKIAGEILIY